MERKYRVLMFAPAFAPFANSEAIVNSKLALAMLNSGWEVDIVSRNLVDQSNYDYGSKWSEPWLPLQERVYEVDYALGNFTRILDTLKSAVTMGYPLDGCRWALRAYDIGDRLHRRNPYDVVLSRAFPQYSHLPAMKLSQSIGIPWIANWNDPWDFLRQPDVTGSLDQNIGRINGFFSRTFASVASWHTFPSDKLREVMTSYICKTGEKKSSTIPHVALSSSQRSFVPSESFRVCFCGRLSKYQDPSIFFKGFSRFLRNYEDDSRISFHFAGLDDVGLLDIAAKFDLQDRVIYHGRLSYSESQELAKNSTVLLAIDPPDTKGILLISKVVDYVHTGNPLLAVTTKGSTLDLLLRTRGGGLSADVYSSDSIAESLGQLYHSWANGKIVEQFNSARLWTLFSPDKVLRSYSQLFERFCNKGKLL